ncbi:hypothetical protein BDC45DRAFT_572175 [Circinella umbellata]|nr:hypothetical protein BDC45DRAFT_572175 [Circinella umbellata]
MTTKIVTYFKTQFPNGDVTETCNDVVFDEEHDRYYKFNLDIGWAMKGGHSNRRADKNVDCIHIRKYDRVCCGYFTWENENCKVYNLPRRPPARKNAVCKELNEGCKSCNGTLAHKPCPARVVYIFSKKGCTMTHINMHSHGQYSRKHLSMEQNNAMDNYVEKNLTLQPKGATVDFNDDNKQLGFIQDCSLSQLNGFLKGFWIYSLREEHEGLRYLKGCYMHWMQSVKRISSNHNVVLPENRQRFLNLTYTIRVTRSNASLNQCITIMINEFPGSRRWIR